MNVFMYVLLICIVVCLILIWYINVFNKYQEYIIRINEAETNIDAILRKRFDLLNKSIGIIKANCEEEEVLELIVKLRSRKLTNFELDRQLYDAINEFNEYKEKYPVLKDLESFIKIELGISESEAEIVALRRYYNDIITDYNKVIRMFPSNIVAKLCGYKVKTYFDGKNIENENEKNLKL